LRVATRETFIGRRRDLQDCLQVLRKPFDNPVTVSKVGVFIQGFGGNGKSTLAARLCDRLPDYIKLVWWQQIDETRLVNTLADKLDSEEPRQTLKNPNVDLKYRLRDVFRLLNQPLLLILDDFEWNLECPSSSDDYILKTDVAPILQALVWAIRETNYYHRLIITCRYTFNSPLFEEFYHLKSLPSFKYKESDLEKKLRRLEHFSSGKIDNSYIERALTLADGNPCLLEWLNNDVLSAVDIDAKLQSFENESDVSWRDKIIWRLEEQPQLLTDEALEQVVSNCLIYEIPVPLEALEGVCQTVPNYQKKLKQAQDKGLIEVIRNEDRETFYRASHIKHINPHIELPKDASKLSVLAGTAAKTLTEFWGNKENENEERWAEIFRLAFADKENPERFREQFTKMFIEVQYNRQADEAYEKELRQHIHQLSFDNIFNTLDSYLKKENWRAADIETAFIFYQLKIKFGWEYFCTLFEEVPLCTINKIDSLWSQYSGGKFGIRGQVNIYHSLGGTTSFDHHIWEKFIKRVGWKKGEEWLLYGENADYTKMASDFHLPIKMYHPVERWYGIPSFWDRGTGFNLFTSLASRLKKV
jgi:hypothetical protein